LPSAALWESSVAYLRQPDPKVQATDDADQLEVFPYRRLFPKKSPIFSYFFGAVAIRISFVGSIWCFAQIFVPQEKIINLTRFVLCCRGRGFSISLT